MNTEDYRIAKIGVKSYTTVDFDKFAALKRKTAEYKAMSEYGRLILVKKLLGDVISASELNDGGVDGYSFCLIVTNAVQEYGKGITPYLIEVLNAYREYADGQATDKARSDVAFAAYYYLSIYYNRNYNIDNNAIKLKQLVEENATDGDGAKCYSGLFLNDYPLVYESLARKSKNNFDIERQIIFAQMAMRELQKRNVNNVAVKASYVSGIIGILKKRALFKNASNSLSKSEAVDKYIDPNILTESVRKNGLFNDKGLIDGSYAYPVASYIDDMLKVNPSYPKYYFFKAQFLFYSAILAGDDTLKTLLSDNTLTDLIATAKENETYGASGYDLRLAMYDDFERIVREKQFAVLNDMDISDNYNLDEAKDKICRFDACPNVNDRPAITAKNGDEYLVVSYSSTDFKPVYCDLLELTRRSVKFWYDKDATPGQSWDDVLKNKIKNCACIVFYLSESSALSDNVMRELALAVENNKKIFCVDLTKNKQISQILVNIIQNTENDRLKSLTSDKILTLLESVKDETTVIVRERDPKATLHIDTLRSAVNDVCPRVVTNIEVDEAVSQNGKFLPNGNKKPTEDVAAVDKTNKIYIVLDGITRMSDASYLTGGSQSLAVAQCFADGIQKRLVQAIPSCRTFIDVENALRKAFKEANLDVKELIIKMSTSDDSLISTEYGNVAPYSESVNGKYLERPGCVGIVAVIFGDFLCYGSIGDCLGILVRNKQKIVFADKQTTAAFAKNGLERDRETLYDSVINNPLCSYGYGVINGDGRASDFFPVSHLRLDDGDNIFLMSDGISDYVRNTYYADNRLITLSARELVDNSDLYDKENGIVMDDKAIITVKIK